MAKYNKNSIIREVNNDLSDFVVMNDSVKGAQVLFGEALYFYYKEQQFSIILAGKDRDFWKVYAVKNQINPKLLARVSPAEYPTVTTFRKIMDDYVKRSKGGV